MKMDEIIRYSDVKDKIVSINGVNAILDSDVASLYGVETREINQAAKNNPNKFPDGYIIQTKKEDLDLLRSKFLITKNTKSRTYPKAYTEKGLYMLATILKGEKAVKTTIAIIETFAKIRELSRTIGEMSSNPNQYAQKSLMEKSGDIMADLFGFKPMKQKQK